MTILRGCMRTVMRKYPLLYRCWLAISLWVRHLLLSLPPCHPNPFKIHLVWMPECMQQQVRLQLRCTPWRCFRLIRLTCWKTWINVRVYPLMKWPSCIAPQISLSVPLSHGGYGEASVGEPGRYQDERILSPWCTSFPFWAFRWWLTVVEKFKEKKPAAFKSFIQWRSRSEPEQQRGPGPSRSKAQNWAQKTSVATSGRAQKRCESKGKRQDLREVIRRGVLNTLVRTRVKPELSSHLPVRVLTSALIFLFYVS